MSCCEVGVYGKGNEEMCKCNEDGEYRRGGEGWIVLGQVSGTRMLNVKDMMKYNVESYMEDYLSV